MTKIIAFAGKMRSGKTTSCNFVYGHIMKLNSVVENYFIGEHGELVVTSEYRDDEGKPYKDMGVLDINQKTPQFIAYAEQMIWPLVKAYNFADLLKDVCIGVLGLTYDQCYGSNEQKNEKTKYQWENMPGVMPERFQQHCLDWSYYTSYFTTEEPKTGSMTAREVMQYVGTEIFRKMNNNIWVDAVVNGIRQEEPQIALIGDCRYRNEAEAIKAAGGKVIHLTRNSEVLSDHGSENDLIGYDGFDFVIDNRDLTISQSNELLLNKLVEWGITQPLVTPMIQQTPYK